MIRSDLIQKIYTKNPHLYQQDLDRVVNTVLNEITKALKDGGRVELRGFGAFTTKVRDGRIGRNPRTGSEVVVEAKRVPSFRTSKDLHKRMNVDPPRLTPQTASGPIGLGSTSSSPTRLTSISRKSLLTGSSSTTSRGPMEPSMKKYFTKLSGKSYKPTTDRLVRSSSSQAGNSGHNRTLGERRDSTSLHEDTQLEKAREGKYESNTKAMNGALPGSPSQPERRRLHGCRRGFARRGCGEDVANRDRRGPSFAFSG